MSIGFNHLGKLGRLGNQMFQYAALRGIAAQRGFDFQIPTSNFQDEWNDHQLFEAFKLKNLTKIDFCKGPNVHEAHFHFDKNLFILCLMNTTYMDIFKVQNILTILKMKLGKIFSSKILFTNLVKI